MDKTIKINLGGILFQIDEEAYKMLRKYLQDINSRLGNTPGGAETIEDIESRIAEIFQSQGGTAGVISKENVEAMISIIGNPGDFDADSEPAETRETFYQSSGPKKLYRNPDDKIISGVCGGIGAFLNMESVWVRLLFVIFACIFGIGFFVYIALWIALPSAYSDPQKREMYGRSDYLALIRKQKTGYVRTSGSQAYTSSASDGSGVGNAFNEVFRAMGKVVFIILRVFLIILGISFVISGFLTLISFVMVFFFDYPGYFSTDSLGVNLFYLPDFLNYIVNPTVAPWIMILSFIVILLPLLALIYWGIKMIFWFRAKDGIISLIALIIWVACLAALSLLLFSEGLGYAETSKSVTEEIIDKAPEELYIVTGKKVADLDFDKEIVFDEDEYRVYFTDDNKGLFIGTGLSIYESEDNSMRINVTKRSAGRSRTDAERKAEELLYEYSVIGDTLRIDEYFSLPSGSKWSFANVSMIIYIPEGTVIHFDKTTENMFTYQFDDSDWYRTSDDREYKLSRNGNHFWIMTDDGLRKRSQSLKRE